MANNTTDYKWGKIETQIDDLKEDVSEFKNHNKEQHADIMKQLREVKKDMNHIKERLKPLEVKVGFIGAFAGVGGAIATIIIEKIV